MKDVGQKMNAVTEKEGKIAGKGIDLELRPELFPARAQVVQGIASGPQAKRGPP